MSARPTCEHCGELPAVCVGAYDGESLAVACDECCGHGCEDGWCRELDEDWRAQVADLMLGASARSEADRVETAGQIYREVN